VYQQSGAAIAVVSFRTFHQSKRQRHTVIRHSLFPQPTPAPGNH
jgi:hypothetical protein